MHFVKASVYFGIEAVLYLLVVSLGLFILGFIINWISIKFRQNISDLIGAKAFTYLFCPGIVIHEISHLLTAWLFLYSIEDVKFLDLSGKNGSHGHVTARPRDIRFLYLPQLWQSMGYLFIGIAPLLVGPGLMLLAFYYFIPGGRGFIHGPAYATFPLMTWSFGIWLYLMFSTICNIELSSADLSGTWKGFSFVVLAVFLAASLTSIFAPRFQHSGLPRRYWVMVGLGELPIIKNRQTRN